MIFSWCPWTRAVRVEARTRRSRRGRCARRCENRRRRDTSLERERESLVEREKLLSKQLSRAKRSVGAVGANRCARPKRWPRGGSDDETTSDRRGLGLGLVVKREFAPNADADR